jgi:hypothetical protein
VLSSPSSLKFSESLCPSDRDGVIGDTFQFEGTWPSNPCAEQCYVIFHLPLKQPVVRSYKHGTRDFNMEQFFVFHDANCMNHPCSKAILT